MPIHLLTRASDKDVRHVVDHLAPEEVEALAKLGVPRKGLAKEVLDTPSVRLSWLVDGTPIAIFGLTATTVTGYDRIWMLPPRRSGSSP